MTSQSCFIATATLTTRARESNVMVIPVTMKDKHSNDRDTKWDPSCLPRSATSSRSSGKAVTPLPQIQGAPPRSTLPGMAPAQPCPADQPGLSMPDVHHLAQLKGQHFQRSNLHSSSSSDLHVPTRQAERAGSKKDRGKRKKKKKKMAEVLEAERKMAEVAHSRATFNRKNGSLPGIGHTELGITHTVGKLPKIAEPPAMGNRVIEIINKHEPDVLLKAIQKEVSGDFLRSTGKKLSAVHVNNAPEIIATHANNAPEIIATHGNNAPKSIATYANNAPEILLQNEELYGGLSYEELYSKMFEGERSWSRSRSSRGSAASWEKDYFC